MTKQQIPTITRIVLLLAALPPFTVAAAQPEVVLPGELIVIAAPGFEAGTAVEATFRQSAGAVPGTAPYRVSVVTNVQRSGYVIVAVPPFVNTATGIVEAGIVDLEIEGKPIGRTLVIEGFLEPTSTTGGMVLQVLLEMAIEDVSRATAGALGFVGIVADEPLEAGIAALDDLQALLISDLDSLAFGGALAAPGGSGDLTTEDLELIDAWILHALFGLLAGPPDRTGTGPVTSTPSDLLVATSSRESAGALIRASWERFQAMQIDDPQAERTRAIVTVAVRETREAALDAAGKYGTGVGTYLSTVTGLAGFKKLDAFVTMVGTTFSSGVAWLSGENTDAAMADDDGAFDPLGEAWSWTARVGTKLCATVASGFDQRVCDVTSLALTIKDMYAAFWEDDAPSAETPAAEGPRWVRSAPQPNLGGNPLQRELNPTNASYQGSFLQCRLGDGRIETWVVLILNGQQANDYTFAFTFDPPPIEVAPGASVTLDLTNSVSGEATSVPLYGGGATVRARGTRQLPVNAGSLNDERLPSRVEDEITITFPSNVNGDQPFVISAFDAFAFSHDVGCQLDYLYRYEDGR